jgi:hypothetical protein
VAVGKTGPPAQGAHSDAKVGRLSSFAFGLACCAFGTLFLGYGWLPEQYRLWVAVVWLASLALALLGQWIDTHGRAENPAERPGGTAGNGGKGGTDHDVGRHPPATAVPRAGAPNNPAQQPGATAGGTAGRDLWAPGLLQHLVKPRR